MKIKKLGKAVSAALLLSSAAVYAGDGSMLDVGRLAIAV